MTIRTDNPSDVEWVLTAIRHKLGAMRICGLATVTSYTPKTQRCTLKSIVSFRRVDPETDEIVPYKPPPIPNCPTLHPSSGGFFSAMPVKSGDVGVYIVSDRSTDEWLISGNTDIVPKDPRRFDLQDAMFLPLGVSFADPLKHVDQNNKNWVFGEQDDAGFRFEVGGGQLKLGTPAAELMAQIEGLATQLQSTASKLSNTTVPTIFGVSPLTTAPVFASIAIQVATIKALVQQLKMS